MNNLRAIVSKLASAGFFHIFGTSVINKILSFLCGIMLVRILSQTDYGIYSYAFNVLSIALLFNGMGVASAILQLCSEKEFHARRRHVEAFGLRVGFAFDILLSFSLLGIALFVPLSLDGSAVLLALSVLYPMPQFIIDYQSSVLRSELRNKEYAFSTNINTVLILVASVGGALLGGAVGLILGRNIAVLGTAAITFLLYKVPRITKGLARADGLSKLDKRVFLKIALVSTLNNGLGQLTYLVGTFAVGVCLADADQVAVYQAATVIPTALNFVPLALVTFVYPYFALHKDDRSWLMRNCTALLLGSFAVSAMISVLCIAFAAPILTFVYGESYIGAAPAFQILMVGFLFAGSLRIVSGNLLVTQRKLGFNSASAAISAVVLPFMNFLLIPILGIEGAALSQTAVIAATGMASTAYLLKVIHSLPRL